MRRIFSNATALVASGVKEAAADPLAVVAANPVRTFLHRHVSADPDLAGLSAFLRRELAAAVITGQLLGRLEVYPFQAELREILESHERRARKLQEAMARSGRPPSAEDLRIRIQVLAARLALMVSERRALALLHAREQLASRIYRGVHAQLDGPSRRLVACDLQPEQERTAAIAAGLARKL